MSFRIRIVLMTTLLITLLFSIGGTMLIHSSFQNSLKKEEEAIVDINEMMLRVVQYVSQDGTWVSEEKLIGVLENLCQQDSIYCLRLIENEEVVYVYPKSEAILDSMKTSSDIEKNQILIYYFTSANGDSYMQSSMRFELNSRIFYMDICSDITGIYDTRREQIQLFQGIFIMLSFVGMLFSFGLATFITRHLRKLTKAAKEIGAGNLSYRSNIQSNDEVGALASAFDNMAEKMEENIRLLKESAEQKEMFMGAFTHELKTPMTSIIGYADLLRTQKLNQRDQADALDYIFTEGKRLENLSLKMLDLFVADKQEIEMKLCSPSTITEYTVRHLRNIWEENNIKIEMQLESGHCLLEPDLFQTLLINLLDNARKAMEVGGKITVTVRMTTVGCLLYVADEGKGIPEEALKHLTEAFYRVDKARARSKGSAGLGLALCQKIVELHHGSIHFESKEGLGTMVMAELKGGAHEKA